MRAVEQFYNNNEEMRYENKIKKNHKNDILRIIIINDDYDNYDSCYDNGKFYYVINASSLSSSS